MATIISEGAILTLGGSVAGQVQSISISHSRDTMDVSNLATTGAKAHIAAKLYEAEISCEVQLTGYTNTVSDGTVAAWDTFADENGAGAGTTTAIAWIIELSDSGGSTGTKFNGNGFVTSFDVSVGMDSVVTASVTIKVTGAVTVAEAT